MKNPNRSKLKPFLLRGHVVLVCDLRNKQAQWHKKQIDAKRSYLYGRCKLLLRDGKSRTKPFFALFPLIFRFRKHFSSWDGSASHSTFRLWLL